MSEAATTIKYPRKVLVRKTMSTLSRTLLNLLCNVEVNGRDRLPKNGPIILAGNHVAELETALMIAFTPGQVEFIGNGDIPFDPNYAFFAKTYGLVPINRGNLDREGLKLALSVLKQNGILGIFPEGGTWDPAQMQAQPGIAWLSYKAQAPILPIGFGGLKGSLGKALHFKHPKLVMNVGELLPPVSIPENRHSLKTNLEKSAAFILEKINELVPEEDLQQFSHHIDEAYHLQIKVSDKIDRVEIPEDLIVKHGSAYARLLFYPTLMDVLYRNLHLPIRAIKSVNKYLPPEEILPAWRSILEYLETNPGFFTYRFGIQRGLAVRKSLEELCRLGEWAQKKEYALKINPMRRYQNAKTGAQVIERGGCFPPQM
ncbi:MAG: 1-acyl-sn-glycerol-3-phosphate acyltransferase [Anaerolineaceae bacterium]|nr:1-acyl-sn-glycerol-3-phosphate acyltransferase [Anaerolineaceae bacterium]